MALGCRPKDAAGALHRLGLDAPLAEPQAPGASPPENTSRLKLLPGWPPVEGACASDGALKTASASAAGIASVPWWGTRTCRANSSKGGGKGRDASRIYGSHTDTLLHSHEDTRTHTTHTLFTNPAGA